MDPHEAALAHLDNSFPNELVRAYRQVGVEEEFVVVNNRGEMGTVPLIFPELIKAGWEAKHDPITGYLIGVQRGNVVVGTDVGVGVLEIGFSPQRDLHAHIVERSAIMAIVDSHLAAFGLHRVDNYAVQPITTPAYEHWAQKVRGLHFRKLFCRAVHAQTASAASQTHVEVTRSEVAPVMEVLHQAAGVFIAFTANSPIWDGVLDPDKILAARQVFWERFTISHGYSKNIKLSETPTGLDDVARLFCEARFIVHVDDNKLITPDVPFQDWVSGQNELEPEAFVDAFEGHSGTLWWNARPRTCYGTIENRVCCQNTEAIAHHALCLGLVENHRDVLRYLRKFDAEVWARGYYDTLRNGMRCSFAREFCSQLYEFASAGLQIRGFGEDVLLDPLAERIKDEFSPAHEKLDVYKGGGIFALVEFLMT